MNGVPQQQNMATPPSALSTTAATVAAAAAMVASSSSVTTAAGCSTGFGSCMHLAISLNNQGVVLLQQGNITDAIQTLNDSLRLIDCAVECCKNQSSNNSTCVQEAATTTDMMMTPKTVCILRMEEPVGCSDTAAAQEEEEEGVTTSREQEDDDHRFFTNTAGTRSPVSVILVSNKASEVMDVELVTSVIFFNISLSYATRAHTAPVNHQQHQQQQAKKMGDHQMAMRLSETGWSILSGRLALATTNSDQNGAESEPYLCMAEKILNQLIELHEEQQQLESAEEENSSSHSSNTILCTYYDLLECVLHSLTMVESIQDMEKEAAAGAA
jgi:hypothetical protein